MNIRWTPAARSELTDIWLRADSAQRRAIASAADTIDKRLGVGPTNQGESRDAGRRVLFEKPLGILFQVQHHRSSVRVLRVWKFR